MRYELFRDTLALYKCDECCSYEHFHKSIEIIYNINRDRLVKIDMKRIMLGKDEVLVLMPWQIHALYSEPEKHNLGYCTVFPSDYSDLFFKEIGDLRPDGCIIHDKQKTALFKREMEGLVNGCTTDNQFTRDGHINAILGLIMDSMSFHHDKESSQAGNFVQAVIAYVDGHYAEDLTLEKTAAEFGYSKYYFSRLFNKHFNTNFTNYFNTVRIHKSFDLIKKHRLSEVFYKVGFSSVQQYITYFKRTTGTTPSKFCFEKSFKNCN